MAGARRGGLSAISVVLLAPALALLGNLATNTVQVSWRWWPLTVWIVVALLVAGTVWAEFRRPAKPAEQDQGEPVVVTPQFIDVDYVREDQTGKLLPASGHLLRLVVESSSRRRVVLRALRPEIVARTPVSGALIPHAGKIETRAFRLDLDGSAPTLKARKRDDFPLWVNADEPEVIDLRVYNADGRVSWRLFLDWTVNGRSGSVTIDAGGQPFTTVARG